MVLKNLTRCSSTLLSRDDIATGVPGNWNLLLGASIAFGPCHVGPAHMHCLHDHADQDTVMHKRANILIVIKKISLLLINGLSSCGVSEFGHTRDRCCHFPQSQRPFRFFQSLLHCCVLLFNALSSVVWVFPFYEKRGGCWVCYLLVCALDDIIPDCPDPSFIWFSIQQRQNFNCHPIPPRFDHTPNLENTSKTEKNYWWNAKSTELDRGGWQERKRTHWIHLLGGNWRCWRCDRRWPPPRECRRHQGSAAARTTLP